jgi:hypothetical protein
MAFTVMTVASDTLPSIALTFHVALATGDIHSVTDPVSLANLAVSLANTAVKLALALRSLLHLITSDTAAEMRNQRLSAGAVTSAGKRITGKMTGRQELCLAAGLLCPALLYYTAALLPFVGSGFSPKSLLPFIVRVEALAVKCGQRGSDATTEECAVALRKHLESDVAGEMAFLLHRCPARGELDCRPRGCCSVSKSKQQGAARGKKGNVIAVAPRAPASAAHNATPTTALHHWSSHQK